MTQQKLSDQRMPPNPAIAELQAIRKEVAMLRRDLNSQKNLPPVDETISPKEKRVPVGAAIFKIVLGLAALLSFLTCNSAGSKMQALETTAGTTVAEAYYQAMGSFVVGFSFFLGATLLYFAYSVPPAGFELTKKN